MLEPSIFGSLDRKAPPSRATFLSALALNRRCRRRTPSLLLHISLAASERRVPTPAAFVVAYCDLLLRPPLVPEVKLWRDFKSAIRENSRLEKSVAYDFFSCQDSQPNTVQNRSWGCHFFSPTFNSCPTFEWVFQGAQVEQVQVCGPAEETGEVGRCVRQCRGRTEARGAE